MITITLPVKLIKYIKSSFLVLFIFITSIFYGFKLSASNDLIIQDVFLAQTHVLRPADPYFILSAHRMALLKVNITSASRQNAPKVMAVVRLNGQSLNLTLTGPRVLPNAISPLQHSFDNSFTVDIPKEWVQPGFSVLIKAGNVERSISNIKVSADHSLRFRLFDFITFGDPKEYHPFKESTFEEMKAKLPVSDFEYIYAGSFKMPAFVIFPENGKGTPARIAIHNTDHNEHSRTFLTNLEALQRANGELYTTYYGVGMSTAGGGWGGGTRFAGISSFGVFWHEFGHALNLPHNNDNPEYPYKGDGVGQYQFHVGPNWGYDPIKRYFIPPTIQENAVGAEEYIKNGEMGRYKHDPMWQKNTNQQEKGYDFMHYSDFNMHKIKTFLENSYEKKMPDGSYAKWDRTSSTWKTVKRYNWEVPIQENVPVYSLFGMASVTPEANLIYDPIAYIGNLVYTFDPVNSNDLQRMREEGFCTPCNLMLKVVQGEKTKYFTIRSNFNISSNPLKEEGTKAFAVNVPQSDGKIQSMELYYIPDILNNSSGEGRLLSKWEAGKVNVPQAPVVSGKVWLDENRNGRIDQGEKGIAGVRVDVWPDTDGDGFANWQWRDEAIYTDKDGNYQFGVKPGTWQVVLDGGANFGMGKILNGYFNSPGENSPEDRLGGDDNGVKGADYGKFWDYIVSKPFRIASGGNPYQMPHPHSNQSIDFGFYKSNSTTIGGKVWLDANKNNQKDPQEQGIANVKLLLWKDKDGDGVPEYKGYMGEAITDQNGNYAFKNLEEGIYQVFVWEMENFEAGAPLYQMNNCAGEADPNILDSNDDNGIPGGTTAGGPANSYISKPIHISGKTLQLGTYDYGNAAFISLNGLDWLEKAKNGKQFNFKCYATDKDFVYLKAHVYIKLPRNGGQCFFKSQENEEWKALYMTTRVPDINDQFDGQFSNGTIDFGFQR